MAETPYAFPTRTSRDELTEDGYRPTVDQHHGMTLRDYFAIRAPEPSQAYINMQSERDRLANPHGDSYKPKRRSLLEIVAEYRYEYADAMLAEREKGGK